MQLDNRQNYQLCKTLESLNQIKYFTKIKKLGLIKKNIKNFKVLCKPQELDIYGNPLINDYYPNIWIDSYIEKDNRYYNIDISVVLELRQKTKIKPFENNIENNYDLWLNRYEFNNYEYNYNTETFEWIPNRFFKNNEYFIIFKYSTLQSAIYNAHQLNKKLNCLKKWLYTIMIKRRKSKLLYQYKCLPIYVSNQIQNLHDHNEW